VDPIRQLIGDGKKRGYVLYTEIDALQLNAFDDLLAQFDTAGIEIREDAAINDTDEPATAEVDTDDPVRVYLREVGNAPRITAARAIELAKAARQGGKQAEVAMKDLVEANLWLLVPIARRHGNPSHRVFDLIQEGNNGLLKAAKEFDHTRDTASPPTPNGAFAEPSCSSPRRANNTRQFSLGFSA
jgi:DNA-directed RNA polymerase sigma subunit (sigma70/sigma32)